MRIRRRPLSSGLSSDSPARRQVLACTAPATLFVDLKRHEDDAIDAYIASGALVNQLANYHGHGTQAVSVQAAADDEEINLGGNIALPGVEGKTDNYTISYNSPGYGSSSGGSNVMKWDMWASMWQPVTGSALLVNAVGNHEMESLNGFNYNPSAWTDGPTTYGWAKASDTVYGGLNAPYQGYAARFPNGAQAPTSYGDIWSSFYYSQNIGPVHVLVINNFVPFAPGTAQYNFAVADLAAVNRVATPWLLVVFHSPPYHTYNTHYKEMDVRAQRISAAACAFRFHLPDAPHRSASWRCTSRCSTSTASTLCSTATCTRTSARTPCTSTSPTPAAPSTSPWVR